MHLKNTSNRNEIERYIDWLQEQPELLISRFKEALTGFRSVIRLLENIPSVVE